jgi:DNA-binding transcriptional ArsR family regulator
MRGLVSRRCYITSILFQSPFGSFSSRRCIDSASHCPVCSVFIFGTLRAVLITLFLARPVEPRWRPVFNGLRSHDSSSRTRRQAKSARTVCSNIISRFEARWPGVEFAIMPTLSSSLWSLLKLVDDQSVAELQQVTNTPERTLGYQLRQLREGGLVESYPRQEGRRRYQCYRKTDAGRKAASGKFRTLKTEVPSGRANWKQ